MKKLYQSWFPWTCDDEAGDALGIPAQFRFHVYFCWHRGESAWDMTPPIKPHGEIKHFTCQDITFEDSERKPTPEEILFINSWAIEKFADSEMLQRVMASEME